MSYGQEFAIMASLVFTGYLIWVSWQDHKEMLVARYSHGLGLGAVLILVMVQKNDIIEHLGEYAIGFAVVLTVQMAAYKGACYGRADVLVFLMCGLYFLCQKGPQLYLTAYLMVQAVSGCLLLLVQTARHNIHGMYLRKPVAYIPYICVAFVLTNVVV